MSVNVNFSINSKCEILINDKVYKSNIQETDKDYIGISIPICRGEYAPLNKDEKVTAVYYDDNNLYGFNTVVIGRKMDRIPMILLAIPENIKKIQRRRFFRVSLIKDVSYLKVNKSISNSEFGSLIKDSKDFKKALMLDLSGGGLRLKTPISFEKGDIIIIRIPFKKEDIFVLCNCIRVFKDMDSNLYVSGFNFFNIDNKTQEKVVAYIFKIMREQMKKS
ncbi:flagellar brake protein [Clostridium arbusti]|uniref:flagellar brake protein n=1 Tax=Clostridium arbusti TaxID=1137848 RepID=UPI0002886F21|nr:flagellar brake domain-containing protein [Clostridium arbusti]